jgi:hypothetical protein
MTTITNYVPTNVGPSRLEEILAGAPEMTDEDKQRVCIITDIAKIGKLLGNPPMTTHNFYTLYDMPIAILEAVQHNAQVELNTYEYKTRLSSLL